MRPDHGDVTAEYLALRSGEGFISGFSEIVWVDGADAVQFLDGQVSQDVAAMTAGSTARSLLLEPKGKLVALPWLLRGDERVGLVVGAGLGAGVVDHLEQFKFRVDVRLSLDPGPTTEVWGRDVSRAAGAAGLEDGTGWMRRSGITTALLDANPLSRFVIAGMSSDAVAALGLLAAGRVAADSVRVEAGEPVMGIDVDGSTIPQESGLVAETVSFTKGCFVGQELVARINSRGRVNRRLVGIALSENVVPPPGAEVVVGDTVVGALSTVGESLVLRAPVAMAMAKREVAAGDDVAIRWDSGVAAGRVRDLPLDDLAPISHSSYTKHRN